MFKKVIIFITFCFSRYALALEDLSTIPKTHQQVLSSIETELGLDKISGKTRADIYRVFSFALKNDWQSYWVGNSDMKNSKFKDANVRIYDFIVANNERIVNTTLTYFKDAGQIFYAQKDFMEGSAVAAFKQFQDYKDRQDTKVLKETPHFAFTKRVGYLDFDLFHIKEPNASAVYFDYGIIEVK